MFGSPLGSLSTPHTHWPQKGKANGKGGEGKGEDRRRGNVGRARKWERKKERGGEGRKGKGEGEHSG